MYNHTYTIRLFEALGKKGLSVDYITKCCTYSEMLLDKKVPVIFDNHHLYKILEFEGVQWNAYHVFYISKRDGEQRTITSPSKKIKYRQLWILKNILNQIEISNKVHGFAKGRSIVTNAKEHVNKECILNIDIKDFFPSINHEKVLDIFRKIGYTTEVSRTMADICCFEGSLPQGAPTSPYLANLVFSIVDEEICTLIREKEVSYTRYADDLTFSSHNDLAELKEQVYQILYKHKFKPNIDKTNIVYGKKRKIVTGLIVNKEIKVPKRFKRLLRQEIYYCKKLGVANHLQNINCNKVVNYKEHLYGKAYYIKMVENELGQKLLRDLDSIKWY